MKESSPLLLKPPSFAYGRGLSLLLVAHVRPLAAGKVGGHCETQRPPTRGRLVECEVN